MVRIQVPPAQSQERTVGGESGAAERRMGPPPGALLQVIVRHPQGRLHCYLGRGNESSCPNPDSVKAGYSGVLPSVLSEQFPVDVRAIGVSLGFSTAVSIFGGLAPLVATWLIAATGDSLSPSYYMISTALLSLFALMAIQWRSRRVTGPLARPHALATP